MKIQDISLRKRLLVGNFLMVVIPVFVIAAMGWLIFSVVNFADTGQKSAVLSNIFEDKGSALSIQFAVSSLKNEVERHNHFKLKHIQKDFQILESQGIYGAVFQGKKILYLTPTADVAEITRQISARKILNSTMIWDNQGFAFFYNSRGAVIMAVGKIPFTEQKTISSFPLKEILEIGGTIIFICTVIFIILLGRYLSRLLSLQILEPLKKLREVSEKIRAGNLEVAVNFDSKDEIGETCRAFDKMRIELRENKILREKYEQNRKELIAGISHDLATPLTALKGYASGILDGIANTPEKKIHYVEMISQTVGDMEKLVESLFLFSKLDLGKIEFNLEPVNLYEYFSDFVTEKKEMYLQRGLNLKFAADKNIGKVKIDILQFTRVVNNLLDNSIKYKKSEVVNVLIKIQNAGNFLQIIFADDGRGVAKEELPKIFDIFYRTDPARSSIIKGSGLGLAVVKEIVLGMSGEICAAETFGGGVTILIKLPLEEDTVEKENSAD